MSTDSIDISIYFIIVAILHHTAVTFLTPTFGAGFGAKIENIFVGSKNHYFDSLSFSNNMENHLDPFCKCFEQKKSF